MPLLKSGAKYLRLKPYWPSSEALMVGRRFTVWKFEMYGPPSGLKSTPWSENDPNPSTTLLPPTGAKSLAL